MIMYEVMTGKVPFGDDFKTLRAFDDAHRQQKRPVVPLLEIDAPLSAAALMSLMSKCWATQKSARPTSDVVVEALDKIVAMENDSTESAGTLTAAANDHGWRFRVGEEYQGNDLNGGPTWPESEISKSKDIEHIRAIAREAETHPYAVAFDSFGCIKHSGCCAVQPSTPNSKFGDTDKSDEVALLRGTFFRDSSVPSGWLYFPEMDSDHNDILVVNPPENASMSQLLDVAMIYRARAFNTGGWVKRRLVAHEELKKNTMGLYVRIAND
eukprot:TRINITY_DN2472_c0_g1_i2.p1 TRINITY_DN2472_c0_g1~~TRINITY_DN2472_c0_g1_i2.p1  ORF type:complete len:268 (+),score=50.82 TRINITY_DN2472_c0_g1_i2:512-1315(+)